MNKLETFNFINYLPKIIKSMVTSYLLKKKKNLIQNYITEDWFYKMQSQ